MTKGTEGWILLGVLVVLLLATFYAGANHGTAVERKRWVDSNLTFTEDLP